MAIPFTCPHCGKSMTVGDEYAGRSGPCAGCGQAIQIPGRSASVQSSGIGEKKSSGMPIILAIVGVGSVGLLCVVGVLVALLLPAVQAARTAGRRAQSMNHMKQIAIGLHNYHDTYGSFPPAYVTDANGKPLYSWRVLILPYIEQQGLYQAFDKTKAWDAPENIGISMANIEVFRSPLDTNQSQGGTNYFTIIGHDQTGQRSALMPGEGTKMSSFTDGTSNTLLTIELQGIPGSWAAPIDPDLSKGAVTNVGNASGMLQPTTPNELNIGLADGSVRRLPVTSAPAVLPQMITRDDGAALLPY